MMEQEFQLNYATLKQELENVYTKDLNSNKQIIRDLEE